MGDKDLLDIIVSLRQNRIHRKGHNEESTMEEKIYRVQYRAKLKEIEDIDNLLDGVILDAKTNIQLLLNEEKVMTACIYRNEKDIFVYYETIDIELTPKEIFGDWSEVLEQWPGEEGKRIWVYMFPVFYHTIPQGKDDWTRNGNAVKRGRIAYLKPDKVFDYVYHHVAIANEGKLCGDKYQLISLHENLLFSFLEEPRTQMNVIRDTSVQSEKINDWIEADPTSHFIMKQGQEEHFVFIDTLLAMP